MRIRLPLGRTLFFMSALLFILVALFPLRLALDWLGLDERGFAAREAKGSIWFGVLTEAQFGSVALGDITARLRTLPLFVGRARIDLERVREGEEFRGSLTMSRNSFGIDDVTGNFGIGSALAPLPIASLDFTDVSARFVDGLCSSTEGAVKANVAGEVAGLMLPGGLSGNVRCDKGALLLPLVSQTGMEALNLRLREDGRYQVELVVRPIDDSMRNRLVAAGFALASGGYAITVSGEF